MEISEDEDDGFDYKEIKEDDQLDDLADTGDNLPVMDDLVDDIAFEDDDDLNDFNALKTKTDKRKAALAAKDAS
jgi:hypothetical protein